MLFARFSCQMRKIRWIHRMPCTLTIFFLTNTIITKMRKWEETNNIMNNKKAVIYVAYVILKVLVLFLWMIISLQLWKLKAPLLVYCLQCKSTAFMVFFVVFCLCNQNPSLSIASCSSMSDTVNTNFLHGLSCKGWPNLDSKAKLDWRLTVKSKARVLIVRGLTWRRWWARLENWLWGAK